MSGSSVSVSTPKNKIIIGIDFGTTCSSIGYVHSSEPEGSKTVKRWPDSAQTTEWVPTTIKYHDDDPTSYRWGYQIEDEEERHEWFKLGLNSDVPLSGLALSYPNRTALPAVTGAEAARLTTDYLRGLKKHVDQYISEKLGEVFLRNKKPQYIITVPAVWSDKAQAGTRQCAQDAGMGHKNNIQIITEPEAAGIYALKSMKLGLKEDDTFVLCDAGGGTVDLISYTVAQLGKSPLIYESAQGSGGLCGSTFLNRIFDAFLRQKFAYYSAWVDNGYHQDAMHRFEVRIKKEFNGDLDKSFSVPARGLPYRPGMNIENGQVKISGRELQQIFEPVIAQILSLVTAQIRATHKQVTAVLLAGGFGTSKYLMKRIQDEVGSIKVIPVEDGETAIVRGALIRGLAEMSPKLATVRIGARKARKYYGTLAYDVYDPEKHDHKRK
ncbi:hypothetical protein ONS96_007572 [Cadophora gregata f. sp. sojae]|nr:hypothetical protein ONS96_007572 [Cadophora gregata f. sp. sojae]